MPHQTSPKTTQFKMRENYNRFLPFLLVIDYKKTFVVNFTAY